MSSSLQRREEEARMMRKVRKDAKKVVARAKEQKWAIVLLDNQFGLSERSLASREFTEAYVVYARAANTLYDHGYAGVSVKLTRYINNFNCAEPSAEFRFRGKLLATGVHFTVGGGNLLEKNPKPTGDEYIWHPVKRETPLAALIEFLEKRAKKLRLKK
ncbi:MAG: hypothetical protein LiPW15_340 [Parcubacteria group bacterium LiPW_15]|nr:MAG: hypothetical protein LiPW15_340 [Parcubacteria group bacterium LiPW_15]